MGSSKNAGIDHANIAYIFDDNYAAITGISMTSLFENNQDIDKITVYLLTYDLSRDYLDMFRRLADRYGREVINIEVRDRTEQLWKNGIQKDRGTGVTYIKMFCSDCVPADVEQLIYLDSDTVVLGSIKPMLSMKGLLCMPRQGLSIRTTSANGSDALFGCAVIVFDAARWREEQWTQKVLDRLHSTNAEYVVADEWLLSNVCKSEISKLPMEYAFAANNCAFSLEDYLDLNPCEEYTREEARRAYQNPVIVHMDRFLGEKPWDAGTIHPNKELFETWKERSLWKDRTWGEAPGGLLLGIERWLYVHLPRRMFYRIWNVSQRLTAKKETKRFNE